MTNINPNDDIGKINHIIKKENKVNKKEKPVAETKSVEASSLDALNSYGKASITFRGGDTKQEEVTKEQVLHRLNEVDIPDDVKKSISDNLDTPEQILYANKFLSNPNLYKNEKMQKYIDGVLEWISSKEDINATLKVIDKYLSNPKLYENKWVQNNIAEFINLSVLEIGFKIIDKFLSDPKLYENENVQQNIRNIILFTFSEEAADTKIKLIDKYLSEPKLYENEWVQNNIAEIIYKADSEERSKIADKFLSNPNLYENECVQNNIAEFINQAYSEEKSKIADKFLSNPNLYENEWVQNNIAEFINQANSEIRFKIVDKFLSEPKLYENKWVQNNIAEIINLSDSEIEFKIVDKFLSDPKLYENENVQQNIRNIIHFRYSEEKANAQIEIIDKYLSEPKLYENENLSKCIGDIIYNTISESRADTKIKVIDKYLSDPKLYKNENLSKCIGDIIYHTESESDADAKINVIDKLLSNPKLYENENIQKYMGLIIKNTTSEEEADAKIKVIDKYLSDPKLYENENVQNWLGNIISTVSQYTLHRKIKVIDELLNNPTLSNNKEIQNNLGGFIAVIDSTEKYEYAKKLFNEITNNEMSGQRAVAFIQTYGQIEPKKIKKLEKTVSSDAFKELSQSTDDLILAANFVGLYNKNNINEIPLIEKRNVVRNIVKNNVNLFNISDTAKKHFPLIPTSAEEYCTLLPALVKSLGIETNEISTLQEQNFDNATKVLSASLANLSDEEFNNLSITQEYSKDEFIQDTLSIVKDIPQEERQKVYDYFGFELHHNRKTPTEFSIAGYPVNLNNGKKLAQIDNEQTKQIVELLRPYVIKFSENNKITCENKDIENALNDIVKTLPEFRTTIGREQYGAHEFDVLKHSLKLMQKTVQNPKFEVLNDSDKKIMILSSLLHDITKAEVLPDPMHNFESSFDAFYISKKFNLSQDERIKLYTLINHHEWLKHLNRENISDEERTKRIESVAFDFQNDNLFELTKIFTEADLKAISKDNSLFDKFSLALTKYSNLVEEKITDLKKTQPLLPTTKLPKASDIKSRITTVNDDYSTNIKGVYLKDGLVVIKYNEVEDWEAIGLPNGSISRGIKTTSPVDNIEIDTGNIKFIAHGLDYPNQLSNFDAISLPDSDALLSVSYMERPESKYRLFRPQGVLLDVDSKYVHGGGETDSGSGYGKNIEEFKTNYAYEGAIRHKDRKYISDLIKTTLNLTDEEYIDFINANKNKSMLEIEPKEAREALIKQFALINSNTRRGNREYNEMYVSNPKVQGVFAYPSGDKVGEIASFINNQQDFLKDYAKESDVPFVVFGD